VPIVFFLLYYKFCMFPHLFQSVRYNVIGISCEKKRKFRKILIVITYLWHWSSYQFAISCVAQVTDWDCQNF
jgi:hypothetical protein